MAFFNFPFHISKDTPAVAAQVQTNFDELLAWVLENLVQSDGTVAMSGPLVLAPGAPAAPEQAANKAYVDSVIPVGTIWEYAGTTLPARWLWCDGQTYTNTSQPRLQAAIGRAFTAAGVPDTSFQVPDKRGKFAMGVGPSDALGKGSTTLVGQRNSELISHVHAVPAHGHTASGTGSSNSVWTDHVHTGNTAGAGTHGHGWGDGTTFLYFAGAGVGGYGVGGGSGWHTATFSHDGGHGHSFTTDGVHANYPNAANHSHNITVGVTVNDKPAFDTNPNGAGTTFTDKNLPPYIALNYIIYAGAA